MERLIFTTNAIRLAKDIQSIPKEEIIKTEATHFQKKLQRRLIKIASVTQELIEGNDDYSNLQVPGTKVKLGDTLSQAIDALIERKVIVVGMTKTKDGKEEFSLPTNVLEEIIFPNGMDIQSFDVPKILIIDPGLTETINSGEPPKFDLSAEQVYRTAQMIVYTNEERKADKRRKAVEESKNISLKDIAPHRRKCIDWLDIDWD